MKTATDILVEVLDTLMVSKSEAGMLMGWTRQQMCDKIKRKSIRADEYFELLDKLGVEYIINVNGENTGIGKHAVKVIDGKTYDTQVAKAMSCSFYHTAYKYSALDNIATELYYDEDKNEYFLVTYHKGSPDYELELVDKAFVTEYIDKYATVAKVKQDIKEKIKKKGSLD